MKINNPTQLKALIKNLAAEKNVSAQLVMQSYMLERLLERISVSRYQGNLIVKGGFLISSIIGIEARTTKDLDTSIKGSEVSHENLLSIFSEICSISLDDNITFEVLTTEEIREMDEYMGIRVKLLAHYPPLRVPLSVDVTTGDKITPRERTHSFPLMFEDRRIKSLAYNIETILAEKLETILSRSIANTRPRDFYDVHVLLFTFRKQINFSVLGKALTKTAEKRGSSDLLPDYKSTIGLIENNQIMNSHWAKYQKSYAYASPISFSQACHSVLEIMNIIQQ